MQATENEVWSAIDNLWHRLRGHRELACIESPIDEVSGAYKVLAIGVTEPEGELSATFRSLIPTEVEIRAGLKLPVTLVKRDALVL